MIFFSNGFGVIGISFFVSSIGLGIIGTSSLNISIGFGVLNISSLTISIVDVLAGFNGVFGIIISKDFFFLN